MQKRNRSGRGMLLLLIVRYYSSDVKLHIFTFVNFSLVFRHKKNYNRIYPIVQVYYSVLSSWQFSVRSLKEKTAVEGNQHACTLPFPYFSFTLFLECRPVAIVIVWEREKTWDFGYIEKWVKHWRDIATCTTNCVEFLEQFKWKDDDNNNTGWDGKGCYMDK